MKFISACFNQSRLRWLFSTLIALLPLLGQAQSANIVISQVYGAGGNNGATYNQDFVELFNRSTSPVTITGWTIQYAAAGGNFGSSGNAYTLAAATIPAGGYYLVSIGPTGSVGAAITADQNAATITGGLSATAAKIALATTAATVTYTAPNAFSANVVDVVGYTTSTGNTGANAVNAYEGAAPAAYPTSASSAILRAGNGCTDTNNNSADFTSAPVSLRTASAAPNNCTVPFLVVNPAVLSFSAPTGQVATVATYTVAGSNLPAGAAVAISSSDSTVLVSTTGAAGSFARTASTTTTASGSLLQTVVVQFTAPATPGSTSAVISNTVGSRTASVAVTGTAVMAYTWNGSASTSYSNPNNWTPARTTLSSLDILVVDGASTPTPTIALDYTSAQTIGQLLFSNNVTATLSTDGDRSLTLDGNLPGDDFVLQAGSSVTVTNSTTAGSSGLAIALATTETAVVNGALIFAGYAGTSNGRHTLQATAAGAIQFLTGSRFQAAATYSSTNPFGTANANSVIFRNGARFEQLGGSSPFGTSSGPQVTTFEPASYFLFNDSGSSPSLAGRTYGTLAFDVTGSASPTGGSLLTIQGDLLVLNGNVSINVTAGVVLQGNVVVSNAAKLTFNPASVSTVQLSGTTTQTLGGNSTNSAPLTFGPQATLQLNNSAGITLNTLANVAGTLQLTNGLLSTTAASGLVLAATATVTGGSSTSFVNGPVIRPVGAAGTFFFPVGKGTAYRPITLTATAQAGTTFYRAEQWEGNPGQNVGNSGLTRVSIFRSFTIMPFASVADAAAGIVTQPSGFAGTATLSFSSNDGVTDPAQLVVAKRPSAASAWVNQGYTGSTGTAASGTVTSAAFNTFSEFALGSVSLDPTVNPLPVVLTNFGVARQVSGVVQVRWATASEQHSAYFEVQRSLDGRTFAPVDKVAAQGTTTQTHTYASLDQTAPAGQLYYRLHQVDVDGTATFSPVVTLAATEAASAPLIYPNPAQNQLTLAAAAGEDAQVIDLAGRIFQTTKLSAAGQLSIAALPAGTYLLRVSLNGQPHTLRFTKE